MARVTRSKKIEILEDRTALATEPLLHTQLPALGEVATNSIAEPNRAVDSAMSSADKGIVAELKGLKAAYKKITGGRQTRKGRSKKKGSRDPEDAMVDEEADYEESNAEMKTVDDGTSSRQPATEEPRQGKGSDETDIDGHPTKRMTRRQLAKIQEAEKVLAENHHPIISVVEGGKDEALGSDEPSGNTEPAEKALDAFLNSRQHVVNEEWKDEEPGNVVSGTESKEERTAGDKTPAKSKIITLEEVERTCESRKSGVPATNSDDDSFVEAITSRSPAKPVSRIEDSVEALDQLEEAIDAIDQAALAQRLLSPQMKSPSRSLATEKPTGKQQNSKANFTSMRAKSTGSRTSVIRKSTSTTFQAQAAEDNKSIEELPKATEQKRTTAKRPLSLLPPKPPAKSTKPTTLPSFELPGEAVARRLKEQREARQAQREAVETNTKNTASATVPRIKSTKQPTRPTFELPGEAISRKKREAHQARLKAQEEEDRQRREFKAKPHRTSLQPSTVPRETITSRARQSKVGIEGIENGNVTVGKRSSNTSSNRPSIAQMIQANTSAPRAPGSSPALTRKPSTTSGPSMSGLAQRTVSASDVQVQRQRAKEIYNRDQKLTDELEKEKREREAAAKLAREAAAERGRQASREWAEKQRAKKAAAGDTGMSSGYGPGGQMGLK